MTLTEFLLARIAEDEAALDCGVNSHDGVTSLDSPTSATCECDFRGKREVKAKRRIVERYVDTTHIEPTPSNAYDLALFHVMCDHAAVYADHPDYREEWRP